MSEMKPGDRAQIGSADRLDPLERRSSAADGRIDALDALDARLRAAEAAHAAETALLRSRLQAEAETGARALAAAAAERRRLERRIGALQGSTSFRLGHALVQGARSPGKLPGLPARIWRLYRDRAAPAGGTAKAAGNPTAGAGALAAYRSGGFDAVEQGLADRDPEGRAGVWLALCRALGPAEPEARLEAARRAFALDPSPAARKALAFRIFDRGDASGAWDLLRELPADALLAAWERRRLRRIQAQADPDAVPPRPGAEAVARFRAGGLDAVIAEIAERCGPDDPARSATALIAAGRALREAGHPEAERPLAAEAARRAPNEQTLRTLMWAAKRQGDLAAAADCIDRIADALGPEPAPAAALRLEKLRKSVVHIAATVQRVPARGPRRAGFRPGRICYVLHNCAPYSSGGYATRASGLAQGIQAAGWEVQGVGRPGFPLDIKPELTAEDVPAMLVEDGVAYHFLTAPMRHSLRKRDYMLAAADALEGALAALRPEFVLAASAHLSALPALTAARRLGIPFFYEVRGFWEVTQKSRNPGLAKGDGYQMAVYLETAIANAAEHVFTLTGPMREEMIARGVTTPITLLPNSCNPARFTPRARDADLARRLGIPEGVPVIGYVGTFAQYEGLEQLAEACGLLARRGVDFRLLLVGNENTSGAGQGPITAEILRVAREGGLADRLILTGRVPHHAVEGYYSLIDIAPFPRKPQPVTEMVSPMKPLEALAMEKAVVVSSVRALAEMIRHDETGLVFYKGSVESLADTLARLIGDPALRRRLGAAGRDWVARERTWDATARIALTEIARHRTPAPALEMAR